MSVVKVRALYDFVTEVAGELCFNVDDVLVLTNQNVGEGWWEAQNSYGQVGLVPQSYFEVTTEKWQVHPYPGAAPPRTYSTPPSANGIPRPMPLPIRPTLQVSCQVHRPFQSPSPVDEQPKALPALPLAGGRPVPPVKPPGLCARPLTAAVQRVVDCASINVIETCCDNAVEQANSVAMLPSGRPVPPIKPPGLFAKLTGMQPMSDADDSVGSSNDDEDDDDGEDDDTAAFGGVAGWVAAAGAILDVVTGDDENLEVEWDDELDEDDDDFYEEEEGEEEEDTVNVAEEEVDVVTADADGLSEECNDVSQEPAEMSDESPKQSGSGSTPKKQHSRITHFTMGGGDTYLFDMHLPGVPDTVTRTFVSETSDGCPCWVSRVEPYTCSVLSPKKASKFRGMKSFIVYQVKPSFCKGHVSRRYKQFNWLHRRLLDKFTTVAIPPLPEKQISGRFEDEFINARLRQLQLWIDRMCRHPIIAQSDVFVHFLTCTNAKEWKSGKRTAERDKYQGGLFFQTVVAPSKPLDARLVERKMENFGRFIRSLDDSVRHLYGIGESNAKMHQESFGKEFQKLGKSILSLAKAFEHDDRTAAYPLTNAVANTGRTVDDIGKMFTRQPQNDVCRLMEGLNEYRGLLSVFPDILLVYRSSTNKIQENAGNFTEAEIEAVESRADVITYTVLAEMNHFQQQRVVDFRNYMQLYLQAQIAFYKQITVRLQEALEQFNTVQ